MLLMVGLLLFIPYLSIFYGVFSHSLSAYYLLVAVTLPGAYGLFYLMVQYTKDPHKQFAPRFWMGPMTNWERIEKAGISWFMIRWLLARNLLAFFCLIIVVINFLT